MALYQFPGVMRRHVVVEVEAETLLQAVAAAEVGTYDLLEEDERGGRVSFLPTPGEVWVEHVDGTCSLVDDLELAAATEGCLRVVPGLREAAPVAETRRLIEVLPAPADVDRPMNRSPRRTSVARRTTLLVLVSERPDRLNQHQRCGTPGPRDPEAGGVEPDGSA